jgi:agmatinase
MQSIINCKNPQEADIILLPANYDKTSSGGKGADKGPKAIITFLDRQIEFYNPLTDSNPTQTHRIACVPHRDLNALSPGKVVALIARQFETYYKKKKFIITLGGDHSVSNGPFAALAHIDNPKEITLLHIDAHFDLRDYDEYNDKPWGPYAHCSVIRRASELGFPVVSVGMRAYSREELSYAQEHITFFRWDEEGVSWAPPEIEKIIKAIKTRRVYLTIDADGFDPSVMPSTGTPVAEGLSWRYALALFQKAFRQKEVIAADLTEVAPQSFDPRRLGALSPSDRLTLQNAAQLLYNIIAWKASV